MSLCPMECRGRKNQEIKGTSPEPLRILSRRPEVRKGGLATRDYLSERLPGALAWSLPSVA